jgi:DNA-directed RNA polymerase II subunit RPB1
MSSLNFPHSSARLRTVTEIQFGLFSAKETERLAVIDIEYPETMYVVDERENQSTCY